MKLHSNKTLVGLWWVLLVAVHAAAGTPDWLKAAAQRPVPTLEGHPDAVILLDEQSTSVDARGEITTTTRRALKILRPSGIDRRDVLIWFDDETRILSSRAWSIAPNGKEYELKEKDAQEVPTASFGELYSDNRIRHLRIPAEVGSVLGYEYEQRERPHMYEDGWWFQETIPVLRSVYTLQLAAGWEFKESWINHPPQKPSASFPGRWVWELNNIPGIEDEDEMPHFGALGGRMVVHLFGPDPRTRASSFADWGQIGTWYSQLTADRQDSTPEIKRKVLELTSGAVTPIEKIRAVASYAQKIRYVAIEIGIGGFQPHKAADTFRYQYGDCKDKANLLATMLREIGVPSYYVIVHTSRGMVVPDVPSARFSFNHVILAIELPAGSPHFPASDMQSKDSQLLFFDPTNPLTPLGELPYYLQSGYGLVVKGNSGRLVQLPLADSDSNRLRRYGKFSFGPTGDLIGEVEEFRSGAIAATLRGELQQADAKERLKLLERMIGSSLAGFSLQHAEIGNLTDIHQELVLRYRFSVGAYARRAGDLVMLRPRVLGVRRRVVEQRNDRPRRFPIEIPYKASVTDRFEFELPSNLRPDELPQGANLKGDFGLYKSTTEIDGQKLRYSSDYELDTVLVPSERLKDLNGFYTSIESDEIKMAVFKAAAVQQVSK